MSSYGVMLVNLNSSSELNFCIDGVSALNARVLPTIKMLKILLNKQVLSKSWYNSLNNNFFLMQFDDYPKNNLLSIAYGKYINNQDLVRLIPDTFFSFQKAISKLVIVSLIIKFWIGRIVYL